jgi:putative ABC transport system substrate-binding protein
MDRRSFLLSSVAGVLAAPRAAAEAQQAVKIPRVGVLGGQSPTDSPAPPILALRQGLRAHGKVERFPDLAADLVKLKVDIIVAATVAGVEAAQKQTRTIPTVPPG